MVTTEKLTSPNASKNKTFQSVQNWKEMERGHAVWAYPLLLLYKLLAQLSRRRVKSLLSLFLPSGREVTYSLQITDYTG